MSLIDITLSTGWREWMEDAFCRQLPADVWYPEDAEGVYAAKRLCQAHCPVIGECLRYALEAGETYPESGVWGGTSAPERRKLARGEDITPKACRRNHPDDPPEFRWTGSTKGAWCGRCDRIKTAQRRQCNQEKVAGMNEGDAA